MKGLERILALTVTRVFHEGVQPNSASENVRRHGFLVRHIRCGVRFLEYRVPATYNLRKESTRQFNGAARFASSKRRPDA